MPNPNVNRKNANDVRNTLANVENLYNQELVDRAFEDLSITGDKIQGGAGLSWHTNVTTVDPNGYGEFTNIQAAIDSPDVPSNSSIWVFGRSEIDTTITVSKNVKLVIEASASIEGDVGIDVFSVNAGVRLDVIGSPSRPPTATASISASAARAFVVTGNGELNLYDTTTDASGLIVIEMLSTTGVLRLYRNRFFGLTGLKVPGALATAEIYYNNFATGIDAINSDVAWNNAPVYYNVLGGGTTNVTPNAGAANGNNVDV